MSEALVDRFRLDGRVVLVTGASSGLGRASCEHVAAMGGQVVATGRDAERLESTLAGLQGTGHRAIVADLAEPGGCEQVAQSTGAIDGLVLAAGVAQVAPLRYTNANVLQRVLGINLEARLSLCQLLADGRQIRLGASIVFVSSLSVAQGVKGHVAYAIALAACEGASRAIAAEFAKRQVRCNVVAPGLVRTPILSDGDVTAEQMDAMAADYPMGLGVPAVVVVKS